MFKILQITAPNLSPSFKEFESTTMSKYWLNRAILVSLNDQIKDLKLSFAFSSLNQLFLVFNTDNDLTPIRFILSPINKIDVLKEVYQETSVEYLEDVISFFLEVTKYISNSRDLYPAVGVSKENSLYGGWIDFTKNRTINWYSGKRTELLHGVYMALKEKTLSKIKKFILGSVLVASMTGCGPILTELLPKNLIDTQPVVAETQIQTFKDLLDQGWDIKVFKGKVVLVKYTDQGLLINDVFKVLGE